MKFFAHIRIGTLLCLGLLVGSRAVSAADGTSNAGYIRLGIGLADTKSSVFSDRDCSATMPAALFGCVNGPDGNPIGAYGSFGSSVLVEGAWGHTLTDWLRGEVALAYRPGIDFSGQSNFSDVTLGTEAVEAKGHSVSVMANAYLELSSPLGLEDSSLHPFLSGGAGVAFSRTGEMTYFFPSLGAGDITVTPPGSTAHFAWSLGAGVSIDFSDVMAVELAYRYMDLGNVETETGDILVVRAGRANLEIPIDVTMAPLKAHEFLISLIYRY